MRLLAVLVATLSSVVLCEAFACSDSSAPKVGPTSGVDPGDDASPRYLPDLTESEREKLCNWTAAIGGGYDASVVCDSGLVISNLSLQQCLDSFLSACTTVTVSEWEACRNKEVSDPCAEYLYTAPECIPIQQCLGMTDGGPPQPEPEGGTEGGDK